MSSGRNKLADGVAAGWALRHMALQAWLIMRFDIFDVVDVALWFVVDEWMSFV